jgi:hypothetical protein
MSDIITNANRYTAANTFRNDGAGFNRGNVRIDGGAKIGFDCSGLVYHILRESGYNIPYAASSVMVSQKSFNGNWATPIEPSEKAPAGTLVYFNGHVGIVQSYDPVTKLGTFLSMTGDNNSGKIKSGETFTTDERNTSVYWGSGSKAFKGLAAVKSTTYDPELDQHANGANADKPVFNIPQASNAGFISVPNNGGFPAPTGVRNISTNPDVLAATIGITPPPTIDAPIGTTSFATALAKLESQGQPNNGYGGDNPVGGGIGAIGRYGFRAPSFKAIGWMDKDGNWTDAAKAQGVSDVESFKNNPAAQEIARVAYMNVLRAELKSNGAWDMVGDTVNGQVITAAGLMAAAWKEGSGAAAKFFNGTSTNATADQNILGRLAKFESVNLVGGISQNPISPTPTIPQTTVKPDGSIQTEYTAKADSADGSIKKGDFVLEVVDKSGVVTLRSVDHIADNSTEVFSNEGGRQTYDRWDGKSIKTDSLVQDAQGLRGFTREGSAQSSNPMGDGNPLQQSDLQMPSLAVTASSPTTTVLAGSATGSTPASTPSANSAYPTNSTTTHHKPEDGGGITVNFTVLKTSPNGAMLKGDLVTYVQDAEGRTTYQSLRRTVGKETTLTEQVKDPVTGDVINTKSVWRGTGLDSLQFQEQRDGAGNLVGPRYVKDGEAYNRSEGVGGAAAWLNERGQSEQEWRLDPTNPRGVNAVNGLDSQSDNYVAPPELSFYRLTDDDIAQIRQGAQNILASADNTSYTVAGGGIQTDGGLITGYGGGDAGSGGTSNTPQPLNFSNLSPTQLAQALQGSSTGGDYGAGQLGGNSFVPLSATSKVLLDADGQIIGEATTLPSGYTRFTDASGNVAYTNRNGQALSEQAYQTHQLGLATASAGLAQSIIGLQNWDKQTTLGQVGTVVGMYNHINTLSEGALGAGSGLGSLGSLGAGLGFLSALESGDAGRSIYSGLSLVETLTATTTVSAAGVSSTSGWVTANMPGGANFLPGLNLALAVISGDPLQMLSAAVAFIPGWGPLLSIGISILGGLFGGGEPYRPPIPDTPMSEGEARAQWDGAGNTIVTVDQDSFGGGTTAAAWMNHLTGALQTRLGSYSDAEGNGYGLIANMLPSIGFQYDPDNKGGIGTAQLILRWTDEAGNPQHRNYDRHGNRADGSTIAGDFMTHAQGAIAPNWQVQTVLAHYQQGKGINLPTLEEGLPQALADGLQQSLQAITLDLPTEGIEERAEAERLAELDYQNALAQQDKLIDIDGDGYLEQTQWLANNQAVLAIDANGNGQIDAGELLSLGGAGLNALNWLDANGDQRVDARDPAFAALRLWIDINGDSNSQGETQTLSQAGITAIDFGSNPPQIIRADNSSSTLTVQTLTGDILGVNYQSTTGGVLQQDEQRNADGTLAGPIQTLHAINTRLFDGQAAHIHGGVAAPTTPGSTQTVDAGDSRLSSTSARTIANQANQSLQINAMLGVGDARLRNGAAGQTNTAQAQQATTTAQIRSSGIAFIPMGTVSAAQEQRNATEAMIRSADSGLFGTTGGVLPLAAVGIGAAAVQWPTVSNAASGNNAGSGAGSDGAQTRNDSGGGGSDGDDSSTVIGSASNLASRSASVFADSGSTPGGTQTGQTPQNASNNTVSSQFEASNQALAQQIRAQAAPESIAVQSVSNTDSNSTSLGRASTGTARSADNYDSDDSDETTTFTTSNGTVLAYPRAKGETANGVEDTQLRFAQKLLLANDSTDNVASNPGQPALRITAVFSPTHGNVSLQVGADGFPEIVFNPDRNYHGTASFSYTVTDQYGLSSVATTTLRIAAVNDAPVTQDETAAGDEDTTLRFTAASLLANDSDADTAVDGDVLRITRVGSAQHGQVFLGADGVVSFIPDANYNGPAQFSYWVGDREVTQILQGQGYESQGTMRLTVLPVNDLPVVTGETIANDEDIVLTINPALLLANDSDVDRATNGQTLSISAVGNAQHGSIALLPNGNLQFTPEQNYFGAAGFSYTVNDGAGGLVTGQVVVNLAPVNDAPVLVGETISFNEDTIQTISQAALLANDSDVDNPHTDLRIVAVGNATHGTIGLNPDGSIRFAPVADYFGAASFTYTVSDGVGGFSVGTATLDIAPVNDAPRLFGEALTLDEDTQAHFSIASLLANDADVDNAHGDLAITAVTIDPASAANGTVSINNGHIVFAPTVNFNGQASFSYTVSDGVGGFSQASVNLTFNPINDAPVANSELVFGKRDVSYTLTQAALLANDADVESPGNLRVGSISNVLNGAATLNADGSVRFVPTEGHAGRGSFDYVVVDPDGGSSTATAQIDFSRVNTSPITTNDSFTGYEDIPFSITAAQLLVNDRDDDNALSDLRIVAVNGATNGTVSLQADGSVRFVGTANFYGNASFNYQVSDGDGGLTWARAQLSLQSVNDAPIIEDIWYRRPIYGDVFSYVTTYTYGEGGTPIYGEGGIIGYTDPPITSVSTVQVSTPVYDVVAATQMFYTGGLQNNSGSLYLSGQLKPARYEDTTNLLLVDGGVAAYDPDGDSAQIRFDRATLPQHGSVDVSTLRGAGFSAGSFAYSARYGDTYHGADPFTVQVSDGGGATTNVVVTPYHYGTSIQTDGGSPGGGGGKKPVTLDLDGNGLHYIGLDDSQAYFDVNNDGWREHLAWVSAGDALLVLDKGVDKVIDQFDEISFTSYLPGARTDLEGLVAFDSNGDGVLSRLDARWREFAVWQDADGNGLSTTGEVITLDDIGITQIDLTSDQQLRVVDGVTEFGQTHFTWADGRTGAVGDVALPVGFESIAAAQATTQPTQQPSPEQMALLMVQLINTVTAVQDTEPLGNVPMSDAPDPQLALLTTQTQWEQAGQSGQLQAA